MTRNKCRHYTPHNPVYESSITSGKLFTKKTKTIKMLQENHLNNYKRKVVELLDTKVMPKYVKILSKLVSVL